MMLVSFDDWKNECGLYPVECNGVMVDPDYCGEYLNDLKSTMKKLCLFTTVTMTQKKSVIMSIKSVPELSARYRSMKIDSRKSENLF